MMRASTARHQQGGATAPCCCLSVILALLIAASHYITAVESAAPLWGLPDPRLVGLEQKPLIEQLLARKNYMAEYLTGEHFQR